jgi:hypothetical protein
MRSLFLCPRGDLLIQVWLYLVLPLKEFKVIRTTCITVHLQRIHFAMSGIWSTNFVVIGTDCIGSCKANYHMITTMMALDGSTFIGYLNTLYNNNWNIVESGVKHHTITLLSSRGDNAFDGIQHNFKNIPCPFWIKKIIIHYLFYLFITLGLI